MEQKNAPQRYGEYVVLNDPTPEAIGEVFQILLRSACDTWFQKALKVNDMRDLQLYVKPVNESGAMSVGIKFVPPKGAKPREE